MSLKIEDILNDLEKTASAESTPETNFASGLVEKTASANAGTAPTPEVSEDEIVKQADAQGRIMAQAFVNELQKQAVAPVGEYPADPGALANNPGLELPRGEANQPHAEANAKVNGIISQLTGAGKVGAGEIATPGGVVSVEPHSMPNEPQVVADQARLQEAQATGGMAPGVGAGPEKEAATRIVSSLYDKYFG
jgi:hypothetical protein